MYFMSNIEIAIVFDQQGTGITLSGIYNGIFKKLKDSIASEVILGSDKENPKLVNGILPVRIPVILRGLKNKDNLTTQSIEQALEGLLNDYEIYSNLRVEIIG